MRLECSPDASTLHNCPTYVGLYLLTHACMGSVNITINALAPNMVLGTSSIKIFYILVTWGSILHDATPHQGLQRPLPTRKNSPSFTWYQRNTQINFPDYTNSYLSLSTMLRYVFKATAACKHQEGKSETRTKLEKLN